MATFMVASNVRFLDDTSLGHAPMNQEAVTGGNGSLEPQDEVFYLSRLNDPTTYFFTWVCKRYRLTVKAEPHNCPICLETGENNIQLSCGHTFCRQCLKAAAEREMTSCALCRKSHTLDPDVLRAQFDQQRVANMSWRLGQTRAARAFSKPSWEATAAVASPHTAVGAGGGAKDVLLGSSSGSSSAAGGGGGAGCAADEDDVKKTPSSTVPSSPKHDGPDIGALPCSLLLRRARSSVKRALLNRDAGGAAPCELRERWTKLMGGQGAAAVLPSDVGGATVAEMKGRWAALLAGQVAGGMDVGATTVGKVRKRWREEEDGAVGECGAASMEELGARWRALSTHFVAPTTASPSACMGAAPAAVLKAAWEGTARVGAIGRDVGAAAAAELTKPAAAAAVALAPECGATPVPVLASRLRAAQQLASLPALSVPSAPSAASVLPEECGALPQHALSGRWASLVASASCGGPDVGSLPLRALVGRWASVSPAAGGGDVGAAAAGELEGRWQGTMAMVLGQDVGAEAADGLRQRWRAALAV